MKADGPDSRNRYQTSMIGLGVLVGLLVLWLVSQVVAGLFLSSLAYSLALTLNTLALVAALGGAGISRRAGIGYAVCGWTYLIFANFEGFGRRPELVTSLFFDSVFGPGARAYPNGGFGGSTGQLLWAAHSLVTVVAGMGGVWFAVRLPGRGPRPTTPLQDLPERPASRQDVNIHPLDRTD